METLNKSTFKSKVFDFETNKQWTFKGERPAIIDFYADWCAPCRALSPVLNELSKEYEGKVDIYKVNTQTDPELAAMFGVRGIPALLFIPKQGQPAMSAGFQPKNALKDTIQQLFGIK